MLTQQLAYRIRPSQVGRRLFSTIDEGELDRFGRVADQWWRQHSPTFAALHSFNDVRVPFIEQAAATCSSTESSPHQNDNYLKQKKVLDVGCGGGILSEALARRHAYVTGIDAEKRNVVAAQEHARAMHLEAKIAYRAISAEEMCGEASNEYDIVVCSEVIEHVSNMDELVASLVELTRPGGAIVLTTINRNLYSFMGAIFVAENILNIVPKGTHQWHKFVPPEELSYLLRKHGATTTRATGFTFSPLSFQWTFSDSMAMNYGLASTKDRDNKDTGPAQG
eukprot:gb/GECG01002988.1/.p1 GENE.gb/GECG01002988.1/~~gb/GECG01002988.1/.p1  ORF type:complete len:280 (+),score=30.85 gb/GECG01002988.1/:1-840(+)